MNYKMKSLKNLLLPLGALALFGCSENSTVAHDGSTEENNANVLWDYFNGHNRWHIMDNSVGRISTVESKDGLSGLLLFEEDSDEKLLSMGVSLDLGDASEDSEDLSGERGLCITYSSDFDLDLKLDFGEETNAALQYHVPGLHLYSTSSKMETACERWDDLMQDTEKYPVGPEVLTDVKAFQLFFYGEPGSKGRFEVSRVTRYKEPVDSFGNADKYPVNDSVESLVAKSFLWDENVDDRVNTGSKDPTAGEIFYVMGPDGFDYEIFGFNIVSDKLEGTDVSAWGGLCVSFYSEEDYFKLILDVSDSGEEDYWYVDIEGKANRHWVKIPWDAFKPNNPAGEKFESAVTHASRIYFKKDEELKLHVYKVGSYDQCGE